MALKDIKTNKKYGGTLYPTIRHFLASNVGKDWDTLYSKICSVAPANTYKGDQIRYAVERMVDTKIVMYPNDYFVDASGKLQKSPKESHHNRWKKRKDELPISKITFTEDNQNIWYEYTSVTSRWSRVPIKGFYRAVEVYYHRWEKPDPDHQYPYLQYSNHKEWFEFTRVFIDYTIPIYEYYTPDTPNSLTPAKPQQRQVGSKAAVKEEIHKRQCNTKEVKHLRSIAARQSKATITLYSYDKGVTAVVSSRKWT